MVLWVLVVLYSDGILQSDILWSVNPSKRVFVKFTSKWSHTNTKSSKVELEPRMPVR